MIFVKLLPFKIFTKNITAKISNCFFLFLQATFFAHTLIFVFVKFTENLRQGALCRGSTHQVFYLPFSSLFCPFSLVFCLFWYLFATLALPPRTGGVLGLFWKVVLLWCFLWWLVGWSVLFWWWFLVVAGAWVWVVGVLLMSGGGVRDLWCWWWGGFLSGVVLLVASPTDNFWFWWWLVVSCLSCFCLVFCFAFFVLGSSFFLSFLFCGSGSYSVPLDFCPVLSYTY